METPFRKKGKEQPHTGKAGLTGKNRQEDRGEKNMKGKGIQAKKKIQNRYPPKNRIQEVQTICHGTWKKERIKAGVKVAGQSIPL